MEKISVYNFTVYNKHPVYKKVSKIPKHFLKFFFQIPIKIGQKITDKRVMKHNLIPFKVDNIILEDAVVENNCKK